MFSFNQDTFSLLSAISRIIVHRRIDLGWFDLIWVDLEIDLDMFGFFMYLVNNNHYLFSEYRIICSTPDKKLV